MVVGAQYVVAAGLVACAKTGLSPGVQALVSVSLSEVLEDVGEAIGGQHVGYLVGAGRCGVSEVDVQVTHNNGGVGVLLEALEGCREMW